MENIVDALKISAAVLIFIIAIASSFSLFGTAKQTADSIIRMRDNQKYLEFADLDTVLYTSSDLDKVFEIHSKDDPDVIVEKNKIDIIGGITNKGDRIVGMSDVISTIYRYNKEKYGVTIVQSDGTVIARYDSNTEAVMSQYNNIQSGFQDYEEKLEENTINNYSSPGFKDKLANLYRINIEGGSARIEYGAPWYGNDEEIKKRISADVSGQDYSYNKQTYYGKNLFELLSNAGEIIEVTNEIDNSEYLEDDGTETSLMQQYQLPTVEIIYIIIN